MGEARSWSGVGGLLIAILLSNPVQATLMLQTKAAIHTPQSSLIEQ